MMTNRAVLGLVTSSKTVDTQKAETSRNQNLSRNGIYPVALVTSHCAPCRTSLSLRPRQYATQGRTSSSLGTLSHSHNGGCPFCSPVLLLPSISSAL